jgi:peptidoglycan/xylan/chitin deacetylase (PgdA/CDA1 family)
MLIVASRDTRYPYGLTTCDLRFFATQERVYFLTFDGNGGSFNNTPEILDLLSKRGIHATFFLNAGFMGRHPETCRMIADSGHLVGNHCFSHKALCELPTGPNREGLTRDSLLWELQETERAYGELTGAEMSKLWRAPYGARNDEIVMWAHRAGYRHIGWSVDTEDWRVDMHDPKSIGGREIHAQLIRHATERPVEICGAIVLMHLGARRAQDPHISVLGAIVDDLERLGFQPGRLCDYVAKQITDVGYR